MVNLLAETLRILEENGKTPEDVFWVGTKDGEHVITWEEFDSLADDDYNNGFGGSQVNDDLVVVGKNWWLERGEYDGSEWWEFKTLPKKSKNPQPMTAVFK